MPLLPFQLYTPTFALAKSDGIHRKKSLGRRRLSKSDAKKSLDRVAGAKVMPKCRMTELLARRLTKMSHDEAAGTQTPQNVA